MMFRKGGDKQMNIKKFLVGSGISLIMAGAMALTPVAFASEGGYEIPNYQAPSQYTYSSISNPFELNQTKQNFAASFSNMYTTSSSYAQQFQISASSSVTNVMDNLRSLFSQGMIGSIY